MTERPRVRRVQCPPASSRTVPVRGGPLCAFAVDVLIPGRYSVLVELPLFAGGTQITTVPMNGPSPPLRFVLKAVGFTERVVVSARRVETRVAETPQKVEIIDAVDIERTAAADLTDVSSRLAFDLGGKALHQRDSYRMGNGDVGPSTSYKTYNASARGVSKHAGMSSADATS